MGLRAPPPPVRRAVHLTETTRFPVFPLPGAILLPRAQLPLHIFEDRYRAMARHALAGDRRIGMIQPRSGAGGKGPPSLFAVGCLGRIVASEELDDGRYNLVLEGVSRFTVVEELTVDTPFRQVSARLHPHDADEPGALPSVLRADLEREGRRYADALGFTVDWDAVARLDDEMLVGGIAQVAPFDPGSKQALLEAPDIEARLARLEQIAVAQGSALGVAGPLRPVVIERLRAWSRDLQARGITLVPVSALPPPRPVAAPHPTASVP